MEGCTESPGRVSPFVPIPVMEGGTQRIPYTEVPLLTHKMSFESFLYGYSTGLSCT